MRNDVARLHDLKLCLDEVYEEYRQALVTDKGWCCLDAKCDGTICSLYPGIMAIR